MRLQSVEGMKVLCFELMEAASGRASAYTLANLAASANELVIELTRRVLQVSLLHCINDQVSFPTLQPQPGMPMWSSDDPIHGHTACYAILLWLYLTEHAWTECAVSCRMTESVVCCRCLMLLSRI